MTDRPVGLGLSVRFMKTYDTMPKIVNQWWCQGCRAWSDGPCQVHVVVDPRIGFGSEVVGYTACWTPDQSDPAKHCRAPKDHDGDCAYT